MFTGITGLTSALVTAIVVLTGGAILRGGAAAADSNQDDQYSNQDDQFLALLDQEGIPALGGAPGLIVTAHHVCGKLDAGMPADRLVDVMVDNAYSIDPRLRRYAPDRLARTETRFISAAVQAYCPADQGKIASIMANPAAGWNEPTQRGSAYTHNAVNSGSDLREPSALGMLNMDGGGVAARYGDDRSDFDADGTVLASLIGAVPSGEITHPDPPQIPQPPPAAQIRIPNPPMAPPPPPQQPPPKPQQVEPPAVGPRPGGAGGSDGTGGIGGGTGGIGGGTGGIGGGNGPAEPSPPPSPPMPPGRVRLAP
jgi:hypothetical protein